MGRRRRKDIDSSQINKDDGTMLEIKDIYENRLTNYGWLASREADLPSALEQAHNFINSGEMNDEQYYLIRWRHYEQTD